MGFQKTAAASNVSPFSSEGGGRDQNWKADAFVNILIPTRQGGRRKLGSLALKLSKPMEKQLLDYLADNGDEGLAALKDRLILDFQRSDGNNGDELDLG